MQLATATTNKHLMHTRLDPDSIGHLPVSGGKRKLLWGSFVRSVSNGISNVWNGVKQLPAKVEGAVAGVAHALKALFTGDYNANQVCAHQSSCPRHYLKV